MLAAGGVEVKGEAIMTTEDYGLARRMWHQLEPVRAVFWSAPAQPGPGPGPGQPGPGQPGPGPGRGQRAPRPSPGRSRPMAGGLVAVSLWGLAPVATRAVVGHLAPLPLLVLRIGAAALVLLPWAIPVLGRLDSRSAARLMAAGALGLIGYNLPVTAGLQWLPPSTAGLLLATA